MKTLARSNWLGEGKLSYDTTSTRRDMLRWFILGILVLNPTHEIAWPISDFFLLRGQVLRAGPPPPLCFLFFVFSNPPTTTNAQGRPLTERSKNYRPGVGLTSLILRAGGF